MTRLGIIIMIMPGVFRVNNTINESFPIHFHGQYRTLSIRAGKTARLCDPALAFRL